MNLFKNYFKYKKNLNIYFILIILLNGWTGTKKIFLRNKTTEKRKLFTLKTKSAWIERNIFSIHKDYSIKIINVLVKEKKW